MRLAIILGTRPEIIKLCSVIFECEKQNIDYFILHTNQHYSKEMDKIFFDDLQIPQPDVNLNVGSGSHGYQTGTMIMQIEQILLEKKADSLLVQGDTNTVLAGCLAGCKIGTKVGHVEAGLRSYDRNMPEEMNRVVADHVSDYCFAPTATEVGILQSEGIPRERIVETGNTIVDAVQKFSKNAVNSVVEQLSISPSEYIFLTAHRPENVDKKETLAKLVNSLETVIKETKVPIIFPVHPRTRKQLKLFGLKLPDGVHGIKPTSYLETLALQRDAKIIFTDSGGIQEEACILGVPCLTLRANTERPQTIEVGANRLVGLDHEKILEDFGEMISKKGKWSNPFGDGDAGKRIVNYLKDKEE